MSLRVGGGKREGWWRRVDYKIMYECYVSVFDYHR